MVVLLDGLGAVGEMGEGLPRALGGAVVLPFDEEHGLGGFGVNLLV